VDEARVSAVEKVVGDDKVDPYSVSDSVVSAVSTDEEALTSVKARMTVDLDGADIPDNAIKDWTRE
jgi:hypothetical protein